MGYAAQEIAAHLFLFHGELNPFLFHGQLFRKLFVFPGNLHLLSEADGKIGGNQCGHQKKEKKDYIILVGNGKGSHRLRKKIIENHHAYHRRGHSIRIAVCAVGHQKDPYDKKHEYIFFSYPKPVQQKRKQRGNEHNACQPAGIPELMRSEKPFHFLFHLVSSSNRLPCFPQLSYCLYFIDV